LTDGRTDQPARDPLLRRGEIAIYGFATLRAPVQPTEFSAISMSRSAITTMVILLFALAVRVALWLLGWADAPFRWMF